MPVRLDKVPAPAPGPKLPRFWLWLLLCPLCLLLGLGMMLGLNAELLDRQTNPYWLFTLLTPFLVWCLLVFFRTLIYTSQAAMADGWNKARDEDLRQKIRQGRRSQQVLAVSLHTALREWQVRDGHAQLSALLKGESALRARPAWDANVARHSHLPREDADSPEQLLRQVLPKVLAELASTLARLPADRPLALLLQTHSVIPEKNRRDIWQQAWNASGIRQKATPLDGHGLAAVDHWLDQRICDQALLLVVAVQVAPTQTQETAESVVGLLFGNRLTQNTLEPLAYLYRPEQERRATVEDLHDGVRQALQWAALEAKAVRHVWLSGICRQRKTAVITVLNDTSMPITADQGLHDVDVSLGQPGVSAPWLAIAAAVNEIRGSGQPHLVFSGEGIADTRLWCTALIPACASVG